ncbi:hypothetical protein GGI05_007490, partial [Coemansia sp. RSA 2603]
MSSFSDHSAKDAVHTHGLSGYATGPQGNAHDVTYTKEVSSDNVLAVRQRALAEIDNAKFGWFHVKACLVAGV